MVIRRPATCHNSSESYDRTPLLHRFLSARVSGARGGARRRRAHRIPGPYPVLPGVGRTALRCGDDRRGGGGRSGGRGGARRAPVGGAAGGGGRGGAESATIDLEGGPVEARTVMEAERRANQAVSENRAIDVRFEDASAAQGLRKASQREGALRIVSIDGLDRSACGGTHVRTTGEIGPILLRRTEKIRQSVRVEFVCGGRAVRRARANSTRTDC